MRLSNERNGVACLRLGLVAGGLALIVAIWATANEVVTQVPRAVLRFEDYPATASGGHRGEKATLGPTSSGGVSYRARLERAALKEPNFARHYVVALWGCGTGCVDGALINVWDRKVIWLPGTVCCTFSDFGYDVKMVSYKMDSALLILRGRLNEKDGTDEEHDYRVDGDHLVHLRDVRLPVGNRIPK